MEKALEALEKDPMIVWANDIKEDPDPDFVVLTAKGSIIPEDTETRNGIRERRKKVRDD